MTLGDLVTGNFQMSQLLRELAPLLALAFSAGYAGYMRGWNQGFFAAIELSNTQIPEEENNAETNG